MDKTILHLLGYLTDDEWVDAYNSADGISHKRQKIKELYKEVSHHYGLSHTDRRIKKIFGEE